MSWKLDSAGGGLAAGLFKSSLHLVQNICGVDESDRVGRHEQSAAIEVANVGFGILSLAIRRSPGTIGGCDRWRRVGASDQINGAGQAEAANAVRIGT